MKSYKKLLLISFSFLFFTFVYSCKKKAGDGGKASIHGSVKVKRYNPFGTIAIGEYPGAYENVYIIYGDDVTYGDKTETNPDGKYEFKYLREGKYKIYVYSKDSTGDYSKPKFAVQKDVEIKSKKASVDAGELKIYTYQ